jgi:probable F420-dependent oxidoreductase
MKFGLPFFGISPRYYGEVAQAAEQAGFESVWIPEHLVLPVYIPPTYLYSDSGFPPITADTPMYDPWVVLAAVSGVTSTIRLATNVFILPLRHPISTARSVVTLDRISGGRVTLGIGVGWLEQEFDVMGQSFHDRGRRTDEIIDILRRLWSEDVIEQHTEHFDFGPVKFQPKPLQKPSIPIVVGGTSRAALRRAGRLGDGWVEIGAKSIDDLSASLAVVNEARRAAGRDHLPFEVTTGFGGDLDSVRRCEDVGVTRVMTGPRATGARITKDDVIDWTKRFADEVIAKV